MRDLFRNASPIARALLVLSACFIIVTSVSLCKRAWRGQTDFSVFLRAGTELCQGAGGTLYEHLDPKTGWFNCIPPAGMGPFMALSLINHLVAAAIWAVLNIGLLLLCIHFLRKIYERLSTDRTAFQDTLPFAVVILFLLGAVCIQTGQTSIIFVACWLGYVLATSSRKAPLVGLLLAVPAAIKLYPILFAWPTLLRRKWSEIAWLGVWLVILSLVIPAAIFGPKVIEMSQSFVQNQILDSKGRVMEAADPVPAANQGIDGILVRYLTYSPQFHDNMPSFPHLNLDLERVLTAANAFRVLVILITTLASLRLIKTSGDDPPLLLLALWCAALYLVLPNAKGRYAIYAFPAFLPVLASAKVAFQSGDAKKGRLLATAAIASFVLIIQLVPDAALYYGIGIIGPLILWLLLIRISHGVTLSMQ